MSSGQDANPEAWLRTTVAFIRARGLEDAFCDFAGGWGRLLFCDPALVGRRPESEDTRSGSGSADQPGTAESGATPSSLPPQGKGADQDEGGRP